MNTFLPYPDFAESARCLDRQRLCKQRVETLQLLRALAGETRGWFHHPAARMWAGWEHLLVDYGLAVCAEWVARGYRDTCAARIAAFGPRYANQCDGRAPAWLGDPAFHRAMRSNLTRKDAARYGPMWPDVPNDLPYVWPDGESGDSDLPAAGSAGKVG